MTVSFYREFSLIITTPLLLTLDNCKMKGGGGVIRLYEWTGMDMISLLYIYMPLLTCILAYSIIRCTLYSTVHQNRDLIFVHKFYSFIILWWKWDYRQWSEQKSKWEIQLWILHTFSIFIVFVLNVF